MEKIVKIINRISDGFGYLAGLMIVFGFVLVMMEMIIRTFFSKTLHVTNEYTAYLTAGVTFLGLAYTLKEGGHIRLSFFHSFLKGKKVIILDIITFVIGIGFFAVITYITGKFAWGSYLIGSRSMQITRTLLWIPQSLLPIGSFVMVLQYIAETIKSVEDLRTGAWRRREAETRTS